MDVNSTTVIVLAGGFGTRIRSLWPETPKPFIPVAGLPFVEWVIRWWARQGFKQFAISLHHLPHVAEQYFAERPSTDGLEIVTVTEPTAQGTAGAIAYVAQSCGAQDCLVTNGDSLATIDLSPFLPTLADPQIAGAIFANSVPDCSRYGSLRVGATGLLEGFQEKVPGQGWINSGVALLRSSTIKAFSDDRPLSLEQQVYPALLAQGARIPVLRCPEVDFLDIGTPESLSVADEFIRRVFAQELAP